MARILVVDDSPTETHQFVNVLAKHGHQVLTAASGVDGIDLANEELPDVIGHKRERERAWSLLSRHANWWEPGGLKPLAPAASRNARSSPSETVTAVIAGPTPTTRC